MTMNRMTIITTPIMIGNKLEPEMKSLKEGENNSEITRS